MQSCRHLFVGLICSTTIRVKTCWIGSHFLKNKEYKIQGSAVSITSYSPTVSPNRLRELLLLVYTFTGARKLLFTVALYLLFVNVYGNMSRKIHSLYPIKII